MLQIRVAGEFIGAIIGKGGETIQRIQRETGTTITITEENNNGVSQGVVDIFGQDKEAMDKALNWINGITAVPEVDTVYHGKIVSILEFGAFVEILPGKEGLLHVSEIDWKKTEKVEDVLHVGDEVDVKLLEIDEKTGKMRLSRKALLEKPEGYVEPERRPRGGDRGPRRENDRRDNNRGPRRDDRGPRRDDRGPRGPRRERPVENNEQNNEPEMF
jgi:polyribonucleotide nucleotidyltransferase